jgi:hypothetical protein
MACRLALAGRYGETQIPRKTKTEDPMKDTLRKHWKSVLRFAVVGFVVPAAWVAYEVVFDPSGRSIIVALVFVVFCPPSLLSVPIIDAEIGTSAFYFVFSIVALLNAALYGFFATAVLRLRNKSTIRRVGD